MKVTVEALKKIKDIDPIWEYYKREADVVDYSAMARLFDADNKDLLEYIPSDCLKYFRDSLDKDDWNYILALYFPDKIAKMFGHQLTSREHKILEEIKNGMQWIPEGRVEDINELISLCTMEV